MHAILIHGMGRTPLAMSILAACLRASNLRPHLFGYSVTFFSDANFRLCLTMVANNTSRDYSLDWVGVQVRHTP